MDPTKARINEIEFLEFCSRILSIRNRMLDIKLFLANLSNYIEFDIEQVSKLVDTIFSPNLQVRPEEIYAMINQGYISLDQLKDLYNKSKRTMYRYKEKGKEVALYPRLNPEEQLVLDKFMTQYNIFFTKNYQNILRIGGA